MAGEEQQETMDTAGGYQDVMGEVARLRDELSGYEPLEERYARGQMEADLYGKVMMRLAGQPPAVRANVYLSIGLAYESAPDLMTDLEMFVYAFGTNDHLAMRAVADGQVQATEFGDIDDNGVLVDEDWYEDHIHHNGDTGQAKDSLSDLFGADPGQEKSGFMNWALGMGSDNSREPDDAWKAIESGLSADRSNMPGLKTGGDTAFNNFFGFLDFMSHAAGVIAPVAAIGSATMAMKGTAPAVAGKPSVPAAAGKMPGYVPTGLGQSVPVPVNAPTGQALSYLFKRGGTTAAGEAITNRPNWLRPISWASSRIGQPAREVITNAAMSDKKYQSLPGGIMERMTRTRMSRSVSVAVPVLLGGVPLTAAAYSVAGDKVAQGEQEMRDERVARDESAARTAAVRAERMSEENVLKRETERREQAREMYS